MPKSDPYVCPKCEYKTQHKRDMTRHFYEKKTPCANNSGIELSEEIKKFVLIHRKYIKPKRDDAPKQINYYNYVSNLDTLTKLTQCLQHSQDGLVDINDYVEAQHKSTVEKLENDQFRCPHLLEPEKFLLLIDDMVKTEKHEEMNIIYDEMLDRIKIYCDGVWESYLIDSGMQRIVKILRSNYLDPYECYLYKKLFDDKKISGYNLNNVRIKLEEYYKFLAIFDLRPYVYENPIDYVISNYKTENPDEFRDFGMKKYEETKKTLSKTESSSTKRMIMDIIKRNHKVNLKKLNERILEIINIDEDFKKTLLSTQLCY